MTIDWVAIIKTLVVVVAVLNFIPLLIWFERKGSAYIQDRRGPNRASILGIRLGGMLHNLADVVKLLTKEDIVPTKANRFFYFLAPMLAMFVASVTVGVIPFAAPITIGERAFTFQIADLNVGLLYILAIGSLGVYGVMLAGWSANSNYTLLGGLRAAAQMVSYEVAMGLALVALLVTAGTVQITEIINTQQGALWHWNIICQPVAFLIFLIALFAETNRNPFDLPEGESELVAGFHTEYSSMKFALFFMAEYAHIVVGSCLLAALFAGGWHLPGVDWTTVRLNMDSLIRPLLIGVGAISLFGGGLLCRRFLWRRRHARYGDLRDYETLVFGAPGVLVGVAALVGAAVWPYDIVIPAFTRDIMIAIAQITIFLTKVIFFCWCFIWVRWTLPRFRYDQLMRLGWRVMIPLALANIVVTAALVTL